MLRVLSAYGRCRALNSHIHGPAPKALTLSAWRRRVLPPQFFSSTMSPMSSPPSAMSESFSASRRWLPTRG